jgi:hypothetical protein
VQIVTLIILCSWCSLRSIHTFRYFVAFHFYLEFWVFFFFGRTGVWTQGFKFVKQALYHLSHTSSPFCCCYFREGVSHTISLDWPLTTILLISVSQVTSQRSLALLDYCENIWDCFFLHMYLYVSYVCIYIHTCIWQFF